MGCALKTTKYSVVVFNIVWAVFGLAAIVLGALGWASEKESGPTPLIALVIVGSISVLVATFGFLGAIRESPCLMWTHVASLFALLLVIATLLVVSSATRVYAQAEISKELDNAWEIEEDLPNSLSGKSMSIIQSKFACCGRNSSEDYAILGRKEYPSSCCEDYDCSEKSKVYHTGCLQRIKDAFAFPTIEVVLYITVPILNLALLIISVILAVKFGNRRRRQNF